MITGSKRNNLKVERRGERDRYSEKGKEIPRRQRGRRPQ